MAKHGGPANIHGIYYQMLWSLLQTLGKTQCSVVIDENDVPATATIILEPSTGGDLVAVYPTFRVVEQIKTKDNNATWSFREVVEEVFPDLIKAVNPKDQDIEYRFVTNARMGKWESAHNFFQDLRDIHDISDISGTEILDISIETSKKAGAFNIPSPQTKRDVVSSIIDYLSRNVLRNLTPAEVRERTLHLLGRFRFDGSNLRSHIEQQIDLALVHFIQNLGEVENKRMELITDLIARIADNGCVLDNNEVTKLFEDHRLNTTSIRQWSTHRRMCIESVDNHCSSYDAETDVRPPQDENLLNDWLESSNPILAMVGESGNGKSWALFSLAKLFARKYPKLTVLLDSSQIMDRDLQEVADVIWHKNAGHQKGQDIQYIYKRFSTSIPALTFPWLAVFLDGVNESQTISQLCKYPWRERGIVLALTANDTEWRRASTNSSCSPMVVQVPQFSTEERNQFLKQRVPGFEPVQLRKSMACLINKPILAHIFSKVVADNQGLVSKPEAAEQLLLAAYWNRIQSPNACHCIARAAMSVLQGSAYPWNMPILAKVGMTDAIIGHLKVAGWLNDKENLCFQIWHDRLLSWAAAHGIAEARYAGELSPEKASELLARAAEGPIHGRMMNEVGADYMWILSRQQQLSVQPVPDFTLGV